MWSGVFSIERHVCGSECSIRFKKTLLSLLIKTACGRNTVVQKTHYR
ncbi:hypothetical protein C4K38_4261 [Pseudomonas chlororaphis subsp. piscium]|nr:hypothetical protein C4K38_4261 [Pseudomonas chlororaphis subsp. piscium]